MSLIVTCKTCGAKLDGLLEYENHMRDHEFSNKPGPGKFEYCENEEAANYLYELSVDGQCKEQFGSVTESPFIWEGLLILNFLVPANKGVTKGAYVIWENESGFFCYKGFDTEEEARAEYLTDLEAIYGNGGK